MQCKSCRKEADELNYGYSIYDNPVCNHCLHADINEWIEHFKAVNYDCLRSGESVVDISDIDYYTSQISNYCDIEIARNIAEKVAETYQAQGRKA